MARLILLSETITTAQAAVINTPVTGVLLKSLTLQCNLIYGSGGTTIKVWIQTSLDNGATWCDIANFAATTANYRRVYNLSALTAVSAIATPTDGTLADNTSVDGILGEQFRAKVTTTGTYANTTIEIDAIPHY
jgi:hypothetical protein